jgi:hypothetical protein
MRYLRRYESHEDIDVICQKWGIENYTINDDGFIDIDDSVNLSWRSLIKFPLKFRNIEGYFSCSSNKLTSLEGCPESVGSSFSCRFNQLTSLVGSPKSVGGNFTCNNNQLTSLEGCPKSIGGSFYCLGNQLTSLEGCPKSIGGSFYCDDNNIETFEGLDFINIKFEFEFYCLKNPIWEVWNLFKDHTKFEFFNDCDIIRENRVIILDRLNFFLEYIGKRAVTEVEGYKCI